MKSSFLLFFVLCLSSSLGYRFLEDEEEPDVPYFPAEYKVSGEKISVVSEIITPFQAWYSSEYNRSRIDYYGGMVKKYYYAETEDYYGQAFEIHPITNEEVYNEMVCYETTHEGEQKDFLPDPEGYEFIDFEDINGQNTGKWMKITDSQDDDDTRTEQTLWINSIDKNWQIVPVRYQLKKFNNWLGEIDKHIIINYFDFEVNVDSEDLEVESDSECEFKKVKKGDLSTLAFVEPEDNEDLDNVFAEFMGKHNRQYENKHEHERRKIVFKRNLEKVLMTNHKKLGYKLALNKFADRFEDELRHLRSLKPSESNDVGTIPFPYKEDEIDKLASDFPKDYDMRMYGLVSPVRDQSSCGSCWAFTLAATIEGALARSNGGRVLRLSEQALVDCAWGFSGSGCEGGILDRVFYFPLKHGVPTDEDYGPYLMMDGYCHIDDMPSVQTIKGFTQVTPRNKNALKVAVYNHGPVAVAIHASDSMLLYSGGIFYDISCDNPRTHINHAVTVVGYGERYGETYWIVKNSWGQDWGTGGYILMSAKNNNCLLETEPYYVVV